MTTLPIHAEIAAAVWPDGWHRTCHKCGKKFFHTREECAYYLAHGWPQCDHSEQTGGSDELASCPFCGSSDDVRIETIDMLFCGHCYTCGAIGPGFVERSYAVESWNIRPLENALHTRVEQAKADADTGRRYVHAILEIMPAELFCALVDTDTVNGIRSWLEGEPE